MFSVIGKGKWAYFQKKKKKKILLVHIDSSQNKASTFQTPDPPQDFNFLSTKPKFWVMFKEKIGLYFFTPLTELLKEEKVVYKRGIFLSYIISSSKKFRMHIWLMCVGLPINI